MQCGELVYRKVPIISNTDNTTNSLTSNMLGNINNTMPISSNNIIKPSIKSEKETIHSGHFMVSHFEAEAQDDEDELAVPVPDAEQISGKLTIVGVTPAGINAQAFINANVHDRSNKNELSIETSLTKLFQCMSLAYRQKLTSPKWNRFKGIRLRWKDKIRLNNVIWRCWHMQFIMKQNTLVCQFASPLDVDTHNKPEAVVLEGKYWKRRLAAVTAEYKKWRLFHRNRVLGCNKDGSDDVLSEIDMFDWQPNSEEGNHMMVDEDYMDFMADTLFSTIQSNQPFAFPDSREIARAGLADFIQPSLGPLQPNLEDFMDTFEPLQEFICSSKLAPVPEEPSNEDMFRSSFVGLDLIPTESTTNLQQQNRISPMMLQQQSTSVVSTLPSSQQQQQQTVVQQYIPPLKLELTEQQYNAEISQQINNLYEQANNLQQQQQNLQQENATIQQQQQITIVSQPTTTRCHQPRNSRSIQRSNKINQRQQSNAIQQQQQVLQQSNTVQNYQPMTTNYNQSYENLQQETSTYQNYQTVDMNTGNTTVNIRQQTTTNNNNNRPSSRLQSEAFKMPKTSQSLMSGGGVLPSATHQTNQHHGINHQQHKQSLSNIRTNQQPPQQQQVVKFQTSNNNFKVPTLPVNQQQNWSPPPSQQASQTIQQQQQTPQAYSQPVQLIQVSDLNILQNNQQLKTTGAGNASLSPISNVNKYTSIKQRGRVRSLSVGPRQPPPPLKSSASDPALLSNTNSVLLAHLLTNNTQTVYNFNSSTNTNDKTSLLQSGSVVTSNIKNNSNNIPILSVPSQPSTTTTLLISTPVSLPLEVQSPLTLPQNPIILNSIGPNTNLTTTNSPKSVTNESPLSPLSPAESLGSPSMRNADRSPGPRDNRRVVHIHAEQKRRYNIKNGFDTLHSLIPQLSQNPNAKLSKAAMLQKGAEYIRQLKAERSQLKEEMDNLRQQIDCLNTSISNCQSMLPATGAPVSRQRASKMREMFDEYVRSRTEENWKFWIFSFLFEPLLSSFNSSVSTSSLDDLYRSTLLWVEQHCSLVDLRPAVLNNLRVLSTKTDILSDPSKLPDEARQAAAATKNLRISNHHHHNQ